METLSVSAMQRFMDCPKKHYYAKELGVVPIDWSAPALSYGKAGHEMKAAHYKGEDALLVLDNLFNDRETNSDGKYDYLRLKAAYTVYCELYGKDEHWEILAVEKEWFAPFTSPYGIKRASQSQTFQAHGIVDLVVRDHKLGCDAIVDHKFLSRINDNELRKVKFDFQMQWYDLHHKALLIPDFDPQVVIYNVIAKPKLIQSAGETDEEYADRVAVSKTGKVKRKLPESDDDFFNRLCEWYREPCKFARIEIYFDQASRDAVQFKAWQISQGILQARRTNVWLQNTHTCFHFNQKCEYFDLCESRENPAVLAAQYKSIKETLTEEEENGE